MSMMRIMFLINFFQNKWCIGVVNCMKFNKKSADVELYGVNKYKVNNMSKEA